MAELYDVVFYGADSQADNLEIIKEKVAQLLKVTGPKLEALFEQKGGTTLRKGVPLDVAQKYQQALISAGGTCNYKPSSESGITLELVSMQETTVEDKFVCPACKFSKKLREGVSAPTVCPQCDIVPAKYEKVQGEKQEREKVRRRMLAKLKDKEDKSEEERALEEERERLQKLEEEIEKELGIPRYLSTRRWRIGSATVLLFAGMGLGVGSMAAYDQFFSPPPEESKKPKLTQEQAMEMFQKMGVAGNPEAAAMILENMDTSNSPAEIAAMMEGVATMAAPESMLPSQQAMMTVATLSQQVANGTVNMNSSVGVETADFTASSIQGITETAVSESGSRITLSVDDSEWDLTMISLIQRLISAGQLSQAYQVSDYIHNRVWKFDWTGKIAATFAKQGNVDTSGMIWTKLRTETNKIAHMHERIRNLSKLALLQAEADDLSAAQMLLQNAESLAKNIASQEVKALSLGYIASAQDRVGLKAISEANFKLANKLLDKSNNVPAKLSAFVELAQAYAEAGKKSAALGILNEVLQTSKTITDTAKLGALAGRVAYALSVAGDHQTAFEAAALIQPVSLRDASLYTIMTEQVNMNSLYQAIATADRLETAEYQAKAHALLARFFVGTSMDSLVSERFDLAEQAVSHITNRVSQARVASELARYHARVGHDEKSAEIFATAITFAQQIDNKAERERVFAQIARNQALVARLSQATQTAGKIGDKALHKVVTQEIKDLKKIHRILSSFEKYIV